MTVENERTKAWVFFGRVWASDQLIHQIREGETMSKKCLAAVVGVIFVFFGLTQLVLADVEIKELSNVFDKATLGMDLHLFYRVDKNPYYGLDVPGTNSSDSDFGEVGAIIRFTVEKNVGWGNLVARFAPVFMSTIDQDLWGLGDKSELKVNESWLKLGKLFNSGFDLIIGRQNVKIEKQFVMGLGQAVEAASWLALNGGSFPLVVRLNGNLGPVKTDLFWGRTSDYNEIWDEGAKDDVEVVGINLHYDIGEGTYIYGGFYHKMDDSDLLISQYSPEGRDLLAENRTNAWDIGANFTFGGLLLEAELVYENGDAGKLGGKDRDRDALGYFVSATYTFPVKFSPFLRGTYIYFSGDDDLEDDKAKNYDPMFSGFATWNRWVVGESSGEVSLPNSNKKVSIAEVGFSPIESMTITLGYLNQKLAEKNYLNLYPTTSDKWADEVQLITDYQITDNLYLGLVFGYSNPNEAAEEMYGDDNASFGEAWLWFYF